jgi:hypothetical protein
MLGKIQTTRELFMFFPEKQVRKHPLYYTAGQILKHDIVLPLGIENVSSDFLFSMFLLIYWCPFSILIFSFFLTVENFPQT